MTCACVKVRKGKSYSERTVEKKGLLKPDTMTVGSQWEKRVIYIHNINHFMHLKELFDVND